MSIKNLVKFCIFILKILSQNQIQPLIKGRNYVTNLQKKRHFTIPTLSLAIILCIQNLVKFCPFILKIWYQTQILMSIKGRNSVANLRKTTIYDTKKKDLVNDDVYTKFDLILSILSQDIK